MRTSSKLALSVLLCALWAVPAAAQSDANQRQAAAEAYDRGTAAYLSGEYEKAAEWFETANRMSPAAPALLQAARAHQKTGNLARAATLALRLSLEYPDDPTAAEYAQPLLDELAGQFMRVDVVCEGCRLDLDGTLQEFHSFFLEPGTPHTLVASFDTGDATAEIEGEAGESRTIEFEAPPPPLTAGSEALGGPGPSDRPQKPLPPLATYIAGGVTGALLIASIASTIDTQSGVDEYEDAARLWQQMQDRDDLRQDALQKLEEGQNKETRTTILWVATGAAAAATAVIGVFLTNWSDSETKERVSAGVAPLPGGGVHAGIKGRF